MRTTSSRSRCCAWRRLCVAIVRNRSRCSIGPRYDGIRDLIGATVRRRFFGLLSGTTRDDEEGGEDPFEQVPDSAPEPSQQLAADEGDAAHLDHALRRLPARQFEAFSLRCLEGLDVAATAAAMDCTRRQRETHYFRALQALRAELAEVRT